MKLLFLSDTNLQDRMFIRDFVHNFKCKRSITVHAPIDDVLKTRTMTKRLSSLLSDTLTYNRAFSGDQRGLIKLENGKLLPEKYLIDPLLDHVQTLILGPVVKNGDESVLADPLELVHALRKIYGIEQVITFADNPLSPLSGKKPVIHSQEDVDAHLKVYEEEAESLRRALALKPAIIASPVNYAL